MAEWQQTSNDSTHSLAIPPTSQTYPDDDSTADFTGSVTSSGPSFTFAYWQSKPRTQMSLLPSPTATASSRTNATIRTATATANRRGSDAKYFSDVQKGFRAAMTIGDEAGAAGRDAQSTVAESAFSGRKLKWTGERCDPAEKSTAES
ncbi:uncharacterized protein I303_107965 [Kwoniella dejecticola CBS 10117]|uniref:Uncharacterized protein n=1 Tax=Kwoniella dejecticola CBS 10117 TaxID=1296121 RepID=A0A1A5ZW72_9TREE|nr:uncharacterized protein I303_07958 [Kwoniella dejecticola CBS 10117]OBR82044.1 hypothetical protein I303_07958 [Kwoniella dejecticola CBS 10117]